jgi:rubrerythrin
LEIWAYDKNVDILPEMVSKGSHQKVWWNCKKCGNYWEAMISNVAKGQGCPECAKKNRILHRRKKK